MILQVPYEILNRGLIAWPMYRYLGGNIENTWHSFRPVYYLSMTDFFKVFALLSTRKNPVYIKDPDENYTLLGKSTTAHGTQESRRIVPAFTGVCHS